MSERVAELTGSMLTSAFIAAALGLVFLMLEGDTFDGTVYGWSRYAWIVGSSIAGSWILLTLGKFWEAEDGDHFRQRFAMLVVGLLIGATAFGMGRMLMVDLPDHDSWTVRAIPEGRLVGTMYADDGAPLLPAYLIYFAGLFAVLKWWAQTDPLRRNRLSLFATAACVLWAWIMHMFCPFPQPWGLITAATISVAVQLAAPWASPKQRATIGQTCGADSRPLAS